jgi:iron complex outermembrane receptor protein
MTFRKALLGVSVLTSVTFMGGTAVAQEAGASSLASEIVVTSRRREERLQDVPLAIVAFSSEQMRERQVRDVADIARLTPGLNFESYAGGSGTPVIRGASQQRVTDLDQNVSTFFDGIFLPRQYAINPGVIGLERVEVVKGPQSALYGRNAFSGAINYVARKPGNEWRGSIEATAGQYERFDVLAEAGGPLVQDKLFIQVGINFSTFDGDQLNGHPNANADISPGTTGRIGGWNNKSYQGRIVFTPTDTLSFDFGVYHFDIYNEAPAVVQRKRSDGAAFGATNCGALKNGVPALYCGELPFRFRPLPGGAQPADAVIDPRNVGLDSESTILVGRAKWAPGDDVNLTYEYGRVTSDAFSGGNTDTDPVLGTLNAGVRGNQTQITPVGNVTYWSHEVRAEYSPVASLDLLVGAIYSKLDDRDEFPLSFGAPLLEAKPFDINSPAFIILSRTRSLVETTGIFGRILWQATDQLRFGFETRYQSEDKSVTGGPTTFNPAVTTRSGNWKQFTPRFTIDYRLSDNNMLYASAANGQKAGGFNGAAILESERLFDSDSNWTYEVGTKNSFLDGALTVNAALFYVSWANRQVSVSANGVVPPAIGPAIIGNAGKSSIKGFEIDTFWTVAPGLNLRAAISYNDAKYADGVIDTRQRDFRNCDDIVCALNGDVGGNQLERQSKVQANFGADYTVPITSALSAFGGFDASYKSKQFSDSVNLAFLPDRFLVDARLGIRNDKWSLMLWGKNIFNKQYAASAFATFVAGDTVYAPIKGPNRTLGLTGRYNF